MPQKDDHDFRAGDLVRVKRNDGLTYWNGRVEDARVNKLLVWHRGMSRATWVAPERCEHRDFSPASDIGED